MKTLARLRSLLRNLTHRNRIEGDLAEELESNVELATQAKLRNGLNEAEARREALIELGGIEQIKEEVREARMGFFLETRWQDLRFALRSLSKSPLFTFTVMLVLALGIGSTALIFSIVDALLLRGPDYPGADRLFMLWQKIPQEDRVSFSIKEFNAWRKQTAVFERLATFTGTGFTISGQGEPELILGQMITPSLLQMLHTAPARGRVFLESEGKAGHTREVILSHALWQQKFGGRSEIIGEAVTMNGEPYTVVGVMPESFDFPSSETKLWVPADLDAPFFQDHPDAHFLRVLGQLKPGVSRTRLEAEVAVLGKRVDDPGDKTERRYFAMSLKEVVLGGFCSY